MPIFKSKDLMVSFSEKDAPHFGCVGFTHHSTAICQRLCTFHTPTYCTVFSPAHCWMSPEPCTFSPDPIDPWRLKEIAEISDVNTLKTLHGGLNNALNEAQNRLAELEKK